MVHLHFVSSLIKTSLGTAKVKYRDDLTVEFVMTRVSGTTLAVLNKSHYSVWLVARLNKNLEWRVDYIDLNKISSEENGSVLIRDLTEEALLRKTICNLIKAWDCQVRGVAY